uniref:Uncharacterized protein n=1 Tax=Cucumis melo TaxID=3656 RepID=A0A9I9DVZ7_CUCME
MNLEEAKAQEMEKLQNSLQELQTKVDETNSLLIKEREAAKKAVEEAPPVIQETQVLGFKPSWFLGPLLGKKARMVYVYDEVIPYQSKRFTKQTDHTIHGGFSAYGKTN